VTSASPASLYSHYYPPPELIDAGPVPWANEENATVEHQEARLAGVVAGWEAGTDFVYVARLAGHPSLVGMIGMHRRIGPGGIEIGYWAHARHAGRGYMSAAARVVTDAAMALPYISRVEIHTDEANLRSAAIPRKLGFRLDRVDAVVPDAPACTGRMQIWVKP
jgi:RimJ/RimL family protein N-acetyltransferase